MKDFTKAYKPFTSKVFSFFLLVHGVKVVTGVSGESEISSSSGGVGTDGEINTPFRSPIQVSIIKAT